MRERPLPEQESPFEPIPEWLRAPSPLLPAEKEPWFYGFLEKYARVLFWYGVVVFAVVAVVILSALIFPKATIVVVHELAARLFPAVGSGTFEAVDDLSWYVGRILVGLIVVGALFLGFLLPILLTVAYVLLSVDVGRTLRTIRHQGMRR